MRPQDVFSFMLATFLLLAACDVYAPTLVLIQPPDADDASQTDGGE